MVTVELLSSNRTFRVTHEGIRNSRKQNVADDPVVAFATIPVSVSLTTECCFNFQLISPIISRRDRPIKHTIFRKISISNESC